VRGAFEVSAAFSDEFGHPPAGVWAAPGRINLIGEHTDYSGGFALPLALPQLVLCAAAPRSDGRLLARSMQAPPAPALPADSLRSAGDGGVRSSAVDGWVAYPAGVVWALRALGLDVGGLELLLDGDVPIGAGLASSAALACSVALACDDLFGLALGATRLALAAQRAENEFVGAPVGVMDQLAAMHGRPGHALFLDTRALAVEPVPIDPHAAGLALLVVDTRVRHAHAGGEYAARRRDCEDAARLLGRTLRDASLAGLACLPDERLSRRARHVVTENTRVLDVVSALRLGADPRRLGPLLTASHASLRDDFEVSCAELDCAVDAALAAGAYGARMTGGGFGGCAIALVEAQAVDEVTTAVARAFAARRFARPATFLATPAAGARRLA
jgi:galactokinase